MEISESQIATLVLGYLKNGNYSGAMSKFLDQCEHFKTHRDKIKSGNFVTRVYGMSLVEYLQEYAAISSIIQEKLDNSNYYNTRGYKTTLVDQLLYLMDTSSDVIGTSSPITSEVETTSVDSLPGNSVDTEKMTPNNKQASCDTSHHSSFDMSEFLVHKLMENTELHAKLAKTINTVRCSPEITKGSCTLMEEQNSLEASKELDAVIKAVVQRTEEDPAYNKLVDEVMGSTREINTAKKANNSASYVHFQTSQPHEIDKTQISSTTDSTQAGRNKSETNNITVFNGTLDTYLKTSGCYNPVQTLGDNAPILVVPTSEYEYPPSTQPVLSISNLVPENNFVLSDSDILAMPTIIVSESNPPIPKEKTRYRPIAPKLTPKIEILSQEVVVSASRPEVRNQSPPPKEPPVKKTTTTHVTNLIFPSPLKGQEKSDRAWDTDLRQLMTNCHDRTPQKVRQARARRRLPASKESSTIVTKPRMRKGAKKAPLEQKDENIGNENQKDDTFVEVKDLDSFVPSVTPSKDGISEIAASVATCNSLTPFTQTLEKQLQGFNSLPKIPISPGFSLTPNPQNPNRCTDYSTSSSYYQPSDSEQNKSIEQLIEESKSCEPNSEVAILDNVVIQQPQVHPSSEASSSTDSDSNSSTEMLSCTVIQKTAQKSEINSMTQKVTRSLSDSKTPKQQDVLKKLEAIRQRTINKIKMSSPEKKQRGRTSLRAKPKPAPPKKVVKQSIRKEESDTIDEDTKKMVTDLWQRGIHLVPNKPPKNAGDNITKNGTLDEEFDREVITDIITMVHDYSRRGRRPMVRTVCPDQKIVIKIYDEHLDRDVDRTMSFTPIEFLLDLPPKRFRRGIKTCSKEQTKSKNAKKRKVGPEDGQKVTKKKAKLQPLLLGSMNIEAFLDKVHGAN